MWGTVEESIFAVIQFFIVAFGAAMSMVIIAGMVLLTITLFERISRK